MGGQLLTKKIKKRKEKKGCHQLDANFSKSLILKWKLRDYAPLASTGPWYAFLF
jgi:hypothetical protein